jgi:PleD family two-component response regulator
VYIVTAFYGEFFDDLSQMAENGGEFEVLNKPVDGDTIFKLCQGFWKAKWFWMIDGMGERRDENRMAYQKILKDPGSLEILVVEDSPTQALQLTNLLREAGYQVITAENGAEALGRSTMPRWLSAIS